MFRLTTWFLILGTVLAVLHATALTLYLYSFYWWFDVVMHLLGGAVVVLGLGALGDLGRIRAERWLAPLPAFGLLVFVMVVWEAFEYVVRVTRAEHFVLDTVSDLIFGFIGGVIGLFIARQFLLTSRS